MTNEPSKFFELAFRPSVMFSAFKVALVVGTILALINHGGAIIKLELDAKQLLPIALSYMVPYCVSTYSAVKAIKCMALNSKP